MSQLKRLPPGWDTKQEPKSGKSYFVNYFTRNVSLEDPRIKPISEHGPANSGSFRNGRHVPLMGASAVHSTTQAALMMETVARIRTMFPTVPETHIKALLIKYHGREAVVVSALQVEKHPVRTPGPFTPPPPVRPLVPIACRPQPKPHSPKMKLRYLKSVFPVVEETILLDTLVNADNNVTHATEKLLTLGFNKRDMPQPRVCLKKKVEIAEAKSVATPPPQRPKSADEKQKIKERICAKHSDVPERVISIALESASFNEETTETILGLMLEEEKKKSNESSGEVIESQRVINESPEARIEAVPLGSSLNDSIKKRHKNNKNESRTPILEDEEPKIIISTFISPLITKPLGPCKELCQGPNESLLLETEWNTCFREDYIPWIGSDKSLAQGANKSLVRGSCGAKGPDLSLRRGPCPSLAKGSIYANFTSMTGSRGK